MSEANYDPMESEVDNLALLGDDADVQEEEASIPPAVEDGGEAEVVPDMTDPKWTEYVMKQFEPDEIYDGYPVVDGLRRVAAKLLGPIVSSKPRTTQSPTSANGFCATVEWEIVIMWTRDEPEMPAHPRTFGDVSDVNSNNTDEPYCLHSASCAATKAEGRALRKALMLSRIHTAEEMMDAPEDTGDGGKRIKESQLTFLSMKGHDLDINIARMLKSTMKKNGYNTVWDIPYNKGIEMQHWLNQIQHGTKKVPDDLKGYDPEWRKEFNF